MSHQVAIYRQFAFEAAHLRLHGFGIKSAGFKMYGALLDSADSTAWSYNARRNGMLDGCDHAYGNCANCMLYALAWYGRAISGARGDA